MTTYETLFITSPSLSEAEETSLVGGLADIVAKGGGTMVVRERLGRRRLAYPIKEFDDGVYTLFLYDAEPAVPKELERRIRLSDKVLRWLTVRLEREWVGQAKEKAIREAQARAQAEAARVAAAEKAEAEAVAKAEAEQPPKPEVDGTKTSPSSAAESSKSEPQVGRTKASQPEANEPKASRSGGSTSD